MLQSLQAGRRSLQVQQPQQQKQEQEQPPQQQEHEHEQPSQQDEQEQEQQQRGERLPQLPPQPQQVEEEKEQLPQGSISMALSATVSRDVVSSRLASREQILKDVTSPMVKLLVKPYTLSCWYFELVELARKAHASPHPHNITTTAGISPMNTRSLH